MQSTEPHYALGLDYGTNTVRALLVRTDNGSETATAVYNYPHGTDGVVTSAKDPEFARQNPLDYLSGAQAVVADVIAQAQQHDPEFSPNRIVGIGVDTTGSTPMPVDTRGRSLVEQAAFAENPDAMAWLWKDHTATSEAAEITTSAAKNHPNYLAKCGGIYSSEWFWSKMLRCARVAPLVADAAAGWMEIADWIPACLCGTEAAPVRGKCAAGHKGLYHPDWNGYPDRDWLAELHPHLGRWREHLDGNAGIFCVNRKAGNLSAIWAEKLALPVGIPVVGGALDAHLGAIGSGIGAGTLVKIMGTSTCDIMVAPLSHSLPDIPGLCGIVPESVLPGFYGLEAGQSAVGDLFAWWVGQFDGHTSHAELSQQAAQLQPAESGLLALDWNNGNRTILVNQRLTGLLVGQTLATRPHEIYRALIEATAFGARMIIERMEEYGIPVAQVVACGGIAEKSDLTMQIYADVLNRPMRLSRSAQTCALGSAIAASVVADVHADFPTAQAAMCGLKETGYTPISAHAVVYDELFGLYKKVHDAFGTQSTVSLSDVMERLLNLRDTVRGDENAVK